MWCDTGVIRLRKRQTDYVNIKVPDLVHIYFDSS